MLADRSFDRDNQLTNPFSASAHAPNDGVTGKHILVNGAILPYHSVNACRYRLRVLNASNFRSYNLTLTGGATITQIGTESGLMPRPLPRSRVLIGPGERVDLIVDFAAAQNSNVVLKSVGRPDGPDKRGSKTYEGPLMQFRVGSRIPNDPPIPAELRPLPDWVEEAPQTASKTWRITVGKGFRPPWLINGRTFDPDRVEARPKLGTTETWRIVNDTGVAHLMHPAPHRLVHALPQRPDAARARALPEGDLLPRPPRGDPDRRPLQRLPGQVRDPLPHARPRGPRPDVAVRGRRLAEPGERQGPVARVRPLLA